MNDFPDSVPRPPVMLTGRRRVGWPDWRRGRRHAQKGRGTREGGGATEEPHRVVREGTESVRGRKTNKSVKRERVESGRAAARVRIRDRRSRE